MLHIQVPNPGDPCGWDFSGESALRKLGALSALIGIMSVLGGCVAALGYDELSFDDSRAEATKDAPTREKVALPHNPSFSPPAAECLKASCASKHAECGAVSDDCGGQLECGSCASAATHCNANNRCQCTLATCTSKGADCGTVSDGCGGQRQCGSCSESQECASNQCDYPATDKDTKSEPNGGGTDPDGRIPVCSVPSRSEKAEIDRVFDLLNEHRRAHGIGPLSYDITLEAAEQGHTKHMALHSFFSHNAPEASVSSPWQRATLCGTDSSGENIAAGQDNAEAVMQSWEGDPGHDQNMLDASFKRVGIGMYRGGPWRVYWGQLFGR
jgi:uncharacterized protein YkwD